MTTLNRPVRRVTTATWAGRSRALVVILEPPDLITIKEKGRRHGYTITLQAIFDLAARAEADRRVAERRKKRGRRC